MTTSYSAGGVTKKKATAIAAVEKTVMAANSFISFSLRPLAPPLVSDFVQLEEEEAVEVCKRSGCPFLKRSATWAPHPQPELHQLRRVHSDANRVHSYHPT